MPAADDILMYRFDTLELLLEHRLKWIKCVFFSLFSPV